jgi:hypothetical protein
MDYASVVSNQKIILYKIALVMMVVVPFIFTLLKMLSWHAEEFTFSGNFINQLSVSKMSATSIKQKIDVPFYILLVYGAGFVMMLSRILFSYLNARKKLATSLPAIIQGQPVFLNERIESPLSFGFPTAKIYFPSDTEEKWTPREIQMCLAHEKFHVEQNDSFWKVLSLLVQALLFFVPWSYSLHRKFELEIEIFCDGKTCIKTGANANEYGNLLLAMTCVQPQNLIFNNITNSNIKRRILAMKSKSIKRPLLISILSVTLLLVGGAAIATTSGITDKKSVFDIKSKIFMDGKLVSSPRIIANANQRALIVITNTNNAEYQGLRMELVARDTTKFGRNDAIGISYDIEIKNGKEKIHSKPHVIVAPNQEGRISISSVPGHSYEMYVFAERKFDQ